MDQLICASLSHTHYWYEVGMLKVPAVLIDTVCSSVFSSSVLVYMCVCVYDHTYSKSMDQPGKVANPARGQLDRENEHFPVPIRA